ncbi:MAG: signal peptidase I [Alphaproteobacteria bacterium]|nr:signal peptidase I [Alphaproteobacteria bacterium]
MVIESDSKKKAKAQSGGWAETVRTVIYAVLIALGIRTVAYEPFNIPSESMLPTLLVGDYLFVAKFSYGYSRHALPLSLPVFSGRILAREPERGDVAVFKLPRDNSTDYIKRIIGLPGDRIQMRGGVLYLNGQPVRRQRVEDFVRRGRFGQVERIPQFEETLPNGKRYRTLDLRTGSDTDDTRELVVPAGHYFAMGDNRDNSVDSRIPMQDGGVGFVPLVNLVGRAEFLFFSTDGSAQLWEVWNWFGATRFERLFRAVDRA